MSTKSEYSFCSFEADADTVASRLLFQAVTFSGTGGIHNLARFDPAKISIGVGSQTYLHPVGGGLPLTFVSTVIVGDCHLTQPKTSPNGKMNKFIEGAGIEGEWDRLVGALGQVIDKVEYKAQIQAGYVSFSTAFASSESGVFPCCDIALSLLIQPQLFHLLLGHVVPADLILSLVVRAPEMWPFHAMTSVGCSFWGLDIL